MSTNDKPPGENPLEDPPPFRGGWKGIYLLLIAFLILQILFYYFLTNTLK